MFAFVCLQLFALWLLYFFLITCKKTKKKKTPFSLEENLINVLMFPLPIFRLCTILGGIGNISNYDDDVLKDNMSQNHLEIAVNVCSRKKSCISFIYFSESHFSKEDV